MVNEKVINTGSPVVDEIGTWNITGNVIPLNWYKWIVKENGKTNYLAVTILSEIVYWYRPTEIRDEKTGEVIGYRKRFHADLLQKSYQDYAEWLDESKVTIKRAIDCLEACGVVKRVFRDVKYAGGYRMNNVMYLSLNVAALYKITFTKAGASSEETPVDKFGDTLLTNLEGGCEQICTEAPDNFEGTNTENTTEITDINYNNPINLSGEGSFYVYGPKSETYEVPKEIDEMDERNAYEEIVKENIDLEYLVASQNIDSDKRRVYELYDLICDTLCTKKKNIRIGGEDKPANLVKSVFLKLTSDHIENVMECLDKTCTSIGNMKSYLLTSLYNSIHTTEHSNHQKVNHGQYEYAMSKMEEEGVFA